MLKNKIFFGIIILILMISIIAIMSSQEETGKTPVEGSSFWVGDKINGEFYFYIHKNGLWYFSNDVQEVYACPIKVWLDPGQQEILDIWYKGYQWGLDNSKDYITEDTKTPSICYLGVQASSLEIPVAAVAPTDISHLFNLNLSSVFVSGVEYFNLTYISGIDTKKGVGILFSFPGAYLTVGENTFENIESYSDPKHPPYIYLDKEGKVIRADFTVNANGGTYNFNGKEVFVPPLARVFFESRPPIGIASRIFTDYLIEGVNIQLQSHSDLREFSDLLNFNQELFPQIYRGENIKFDDFILEKGEVMFTENGILLLEEREDSNAIWNGMNIGAFGSEGDIKKNILIANSDADLTDYSGNWIQQRDANHLDISITEPGITRLKVFEGNDFFDALENDRLEFLLSNKNNLEMIKEEGLVNCDIGEGKFVLVNGNNYIEFREGKVYYQSNLSNFGDDFNSIPLKLKSESSIKYGEEILGSFDSWLFDESNTISYIQGKTVRLSLVHGSEEAIQ